LDQKSAYGGTKQSKEKGGGAKVTKRNETQNHGLFLDNHRGGIRGGKEKGREAGESRGVSPQVVQGSSNEKGGCPRSPQLTKLGGVNSKGRAALQPKGTTRWERKPGPV